MLRHVLLATMLCAVLPAAIAGSDNSAQRGAARYFADLPLTDQNGQRVELGALIDGHTVVIQSFFSRCTAGCPTTMNTLKALQTRFGARMERDVRLISISVDPQADTPAVLHDYAARLGAHAGWYFLTGDKHQVDAALARIGQTTDTPDDHMQLLIVGNERTGLWKKVFALDRPDAVMDLVRGVADDAPPGVPTD